MHGALPAESHGLCRSQTGKFTPALIYEYAVFLRIGHHNSYRSQGGESSETLFAFPQRSLDVPLFGDIQKQGQDGWLSLPVDARRGG